MVARKGEGRRAKGRRAKERTVARKGRDYATIIFIAFSLRDFKYRFAFSLVAFSLRDFKYRFTFSFDDSLLAMLAMWQVECFPFPIPFPFPLPLPPLLPLFLTPNAFCKDWLPFQLPYFDCPIITGKH